MADIIRLFDRRIPQHNFIDRFTQFLVEKNLHGDTKFSAEFAIEKKRNSCPAYHAQEHYLSISPTGRRIVTPFRTDIALVWCDDEGPLYGGPETENLIMAHARQFVEKLSNAGFDPELISEECRKIEYANIDGFPCIRDGVRTRPIKQSLDVLAVMGLQDHEYIIVGSEGPHAIERKKAGHLR